LSAGSYGLHVVGIVVLMHNAHGVLAVIAPAIRDVNTVRVDVIAAHNARARKDAIVTMLQRY